MVTEEGTADIEAEAPSPKPPAQQPLPEEASSSLLIRRKKKGRRGSSAGRVVWDQSILCVYCGVQEGLQCRCCLRRPVTTGENHRREGNLGVLDERGSSRKRPRSARFKLM
ncbi:uncharacterized protein LOC120256153 [Dioscorea cayenensis subsp. rotundata]|uniref:Uncharacterized protein LOC120256153 n=1 Tax=Dioscorea cayennensis subsp. rotundata TaxID=55577 RepID=A0AB40AXJ0_DIOCR|nr:uncharacterized protein LOC120256153 [Dioscorea cayenensis subsp. rotundata]